MNTLANGRLKLSEGVAQDDVQHNEKQTTASMPALAESPILLATVTSQIAWY